METPIPADPDPGAISDLTEIPETPSTETDIMDDISGDRNYSGNIISGGMTPYIEFSQADYMQAQEEGKVILLYYYASWCPICAEEQATVIEALEEVNNPNVIAFRVNYRDSEITDEEEDIARKFGVSSQHTKVIVVNGERVAKSPATWEFADYLSEINNALAI
jgi:thiol-disulfide isomerase/thioredoxin